MYDPFHLPRDGATVSRRFGRFGVLTSNVDQCVLCCRASMGIRKAKCYLSQGERLERALCAADTDGRSE
jgi:hypothetical protein